MKTFFIFLILLPILLFGEWSEEFQVNDPDNQFDNCVDLTIDGNECPWFFWYGNEDQGIGYAYTKLENGIISDEGIINDEIGNYGTSIGSCTNTDGNPWALWPYLENDQNFSIRASQWNGFDWEVEIVDEYSLGETDVACDESSGKLWGFYEGIPGRIIGRVYDEGWTGYWQLDDTSGIDSRSPIVDVDNEGNPWIVWHEGLIDNIGAPAGEVYYSKLEGNVFSAGQCIGIPDDKMIARPQIAIAPDGTPWVVWCKYMEKDDDEGYWCGRKSEIFFSRFINDNWTTPEMLNTPDDFYDKYPSIVFDPATGFPTVIWDGKLENNERYLYSAKWNGTEFEPEEMIAGNSGNYWAESAYDENGNLYIAYLRSMEIYMMIDYAPVICSADSIEAEPANAVTIPINITDLAATGTDLISFALIYDTELLTEINVSLENTILAETDWNCEYSQNGNQLSVTLSGDDIVVHGGTIANLEFIVSENAQNGDETVLHFESFIFNEGLPESITEDGIFIVSSTFSEDDQITENLNFIKSHNYPNPFNPSTTISFSLTTENTENTELIIYNLKAQKIRQYSILNNQSSIIWDGKDDNGNKVSSGIYLYKIKVGDLSLTKKMILMK